MFRLYLVTDRHQCAPRSLVDCVAAALRGGVDAVQLREKDLNARDLTRLAAELLPLCHAHAARLLINDRVDVALAVDADGVHLPADSFPVAKARQLLGAAKLVGVSAHSVPEVLAAQRDGADFVVIGPVFATPSKARYGVPLGLDVLRDAIAGVSMPVIAIGGITEERVRVVRSAGAAGVAVISAVLASPDPERAAAGLAREADN